MRLMRLLALAFMALALTRCGKFPQPEVDAEQHSLRRHARYFGDTGLSQAVEELTICQDRFWRSGFGGALLEHVAFLSVNEEHINIGTVIQFLPAQFAHAEKATCGRLPTIGRVPVPGLAKAFRQPLMTDAPHPIQANVGHIGNLTDDFFNRPEA